MAGQVSVLLEVQVPSPTHTLTAGRRQSWHRKEGLRLQTKEPGLHWKGLRSREKGTQEICFVLEDHAVHQMVSAAPSDSQETDSEPGSSWKSPAVCLHEK